MSKEIYISSTPHETRLAIVENDALTEIYYERENEYTLAGSIYNGKVTRVLPGMQSSFVDIGLERDAFLYITDFMEEAGDSADFDSGDANHGSRREGRGDRNGNAPVLEGTPDQSADLAGQPSERTDRGDRSDRGRGDRGRRGRRDRGGNRERQPGSDIAPQVPVNSQADFGRPISFASPDAPTDGSEEPSLGEGAPGADGTRRWRGRRGRRRGRGNGPREGFPQTTASDAQPAFTTEEASSDEHYDDALELDASAADQPVEDNSAPIASANPSSGESQEYSRRDRGDRGDRGPRNDRDGRRDRGGRDRGDRNRDDRGPRVPRGFAPKVSLYGVENTPAYGESVETEAPVEPIILPGESLSKYRKGGDEPAVATTPKAVDANVIVPSAPSFVIPEGWDGGATLPGESRAIAALRPAPSIVTTPAPTTAAPSPLRSPRTHRNHALKSFKSRTESASPRASKSSPKFSSQPIPN